MSTFFTRRRLLKSAAIGAAALTAACQPQVVEVPKEVTVVVKETVVVEKAAPQKQVALRCHVRAGGDQAWHETRAKDFMAEHPNIKIVIEAFPGSMYFPKILSMNATKTVGDVVFTNLAGGRMMQWSHQGVFMPLTSYIAIDEEFKVEDYFPAAIHAYTFEGVLHALPEKAATNYCILHYNKTAMDEAGIDYPTDEWTVDDLVEASLKLTKDTTGDGKIDLWGFAPKQGANAYIVDMRNWGGDFISADGKECLADSPGSAAAMKWLQDCFLNFKITPGPELADLAGNGNRDFWAAGKAVFWQDQALHSGTIKNLTKDKFEAGTLQFPMGPDGDRGSMLGSTGLGISPHSKNPDAAWEWIKFMTNGESGVRRTLEVGYQSTPGARFDVWEDERIMSDPYMQEYKKVVLRLQPWHAPWNFRAAETHSFISNTYPKMWIEKTPAEEVTAEVAEETRKILAMPRP